MIITDPRGYSIQPEDINTSQRFWDAFDHLETEVSAWWIVRLLQERGCGWVPFTREEIQTLYSSRYKDRFSFNRLIEAEMVPPDLARAFAGHHDPLVPVGGGWVVCDDNGVHRVTQEFVDRCYKSSPKKKAEAV